jgi:hypothetical protein
MPRRKGFIAAGFVGMASGLSPYPVQASLYYFVVYLKFQIHIL